MKISEFIQSSISAPESPRRVYMSFSVGSEPIEIKEIPVTKNFSETGVESDPVCFSLRERIRQGNFKPRTILRTRIREVAAYCRSSSAEKILKNRHIILTYINEYVYQQIQSLLSDPKNSQFNLILLLGLNTVMKNTKSARKFQILMRRIKTSLKTRGVIPMNLQGKLNQAYGEFWSDLVDGIEKRYVPKQKWGILTNGKLDTTAQIETVDDKPIRKLAAFSKSLKMSNDTVELIKKIEDFLSGLSESATTKEIVSWLNDLRSTPVCKNKNNKDEFLSYDILGDNHFTVLIGNYIFDGMGLVELTDYIENSLNPTTMMNFSQIGLFPYLTQWSDDHKKCFVQALDFNWYVFEIIENDEDKTSKVKVTAYPVRTTPFKVEDPLYAKEVGVMNFPNIVDAKVYVNQTISKLCTRIRCFSDDQSQAFNTDKAKVISQTENYDLLWWTVDGKIHEVLIEKDGDNYKVQDRIHEGDTPTKFLDLETYKKSEPDIEYSEVTEKELGDLIEKYESGNLN